MGLNLLRRSRFLLGGFAACTAPIVFGRPGAADGARSGPWCVPLTKAGRRDAFDFSLYMLEPSDAVFTLREMQGKPVWLNFFTSWCPPCNAEAADIVRISKKYGDALHMVGIDVKEEPEKAREFRDKHAIRYPIALDSTGSVFKDLGLHAYPTHVFLDAGGYISCVSVGDLTVEQMDNEVAVALARVPAQVAPRRQSPASSPP